MDTHTQAPETDTCGWRGGQIGGKQQAHSSRASLCVYRSAPASQTHLREWMRLNSGSSCRWKIPEAKPVTKR